MDHSREDRVPSNGDLTRILHSWRGGDHAALAELMPHIYGELHRLACQHLRGERRGHTLQATALVHEAYLRLFGAGDNDWRDRVHFFSMAAQVMRRILVDHARTKGAAKRGGDRKPIPIEAVQLVVEPPPVELLDLDTALSKLAQLDDRKAKLIELRFFGGLSLEECAKMSECSTSHVWQELELAKAWLYDEITKGEDD